MYQLIDYNIDYLAFQKMPVYIVGTGMEAVKAYKRIFVRSIQVGGLFCPAGIFSLDDAWLGKPFCSVIVQKFADGKNPEGIYLVTENEYFKAKWIIEILEQNGIKQIYVSLPVLQFPMGKEKYEQNRTLFLENRRKIEYVNERLTDQKSKIIWENLLKARWDQQSDRDRLYKEAFRLSTETGSKQYFPVGEIFEKPDREGIIVDGGALSGATTIKFAQWCGNKYNRIFAFEPDVRYRGLLETNIRCHRIERVEIIYAGLYDHSGIAAFSPEPVGSSKVGQGNEKVPVVTIDELFLNAEKPITYIKLDIEGSECKALNGAKQIIERDHPKMAICIYHGNEDIYQVPYKILKDFGYTKAYIRHYSDTVGESLIYAEK